VLGVYQSLQARAEIATYPLKTENLFLTLQRTQFASIINTNSLIMYGETMAVYCEDNTE
jgi:hypothetical protein